MEPSNSCRARARTSCPCHHHHHHYCHHHHCYHHHCYHHHHYQIFLPHNHQLTTLPHHHHHHHHRRQHYNFNCHRRVISGIAPFSPHNSHPIPKPPVKYDTNVEGGDVVFRNGPDNCAEILRDQQYEGLDMAEEDDEEPIFVLTDEWKDFFAKSEAKRKLDKKHAGKKI